MTRVLREPTRPPRALDRAERGRHEFRDVSHPGVPEVRMDLVLIAPSGVVVVTWAPHTTGVAGEPVDTGMLAAVRSTAELLADLLPVRYRTRVRPVICRSDDHPGAEMVDGVLVTTHGTLEHILRSSPVVLSTSEVHALARALDARLEACPATYPDRPVQRVRRRVLASATAAASVAAALVLLHEVIRVPLPW